MSCFGPASVQGVAPEATWPAASSSAAVRGQQLLQEGLDASLTIIRDRRSVWVRITQHACSPAVVAREGLDRGGIFLPVSESSENQLISHPSTCFTPDSELRMRILIVLTSGTVTIGLHWISNLQLLSGRKTIDP
jgi:hypothetical protein